MVVHGDVASPRQLLDILKADDRYNLFAPPESDILPDEIFLRPPVLQDDDVPRMVWGFRYRSLLGAQADAASPAEVPVLRVSGATPQKVLSLALQAENRRNSFRWDEIDRIFRLAREAGESDVPEEICRGVDDRRDITELLERYRNLPETLKHPLAEGTLDIRTAELVPPALLPRWDQLMATTDGVSFSERRQIIRLAADFVRSGRVSVDDVLSHIEGLSGRDVLEALRRRRYPTAERLDSQLQEFRNRFFRGKGITVDFPTNYEGDYLQFTFRARSGRELQQRIRSLQTVEDQVDGLVDLLLTDD
jgi:DNA-binding transcriptional ArsR family regulator